MAAAKTTVTVTLYGVKREIVLPKADADRIEKLAKNRLAATPAMGLEKARSAEYIAYLNKKGIDVGQNVKIQAFIAGRQPAGSAISVYKKDLTTGEDPIDTRGILQRLEDSKTGCNWNLPPHEWSLPYTKNKLRAERRGRLFHYYTNKSQKNVVIEGINEGNAGVLPPGATNFAEALDKVPYKFKLGESKEPFPGARKYGFQFMWNPESYSISSALQAEMTPSPGDAFAAGQAMFPGTSNLQFTVRLDRVNDFACFLGKRIRDADGKLVKTSSLLYGNNSLDVVLPDDVCEGYIRDYYKERIPRQSTTKRDFWSNQKHLIQWLLKFGTMSDIEYIYRAVNDISIVSKPLPDGFFTADVGYLAFTLVAVELGETYYIGFITGLSINHLLFSENYVPIRSDVTISMNLMAQASASTAGTSGTNLVASNPDAANLRQRGNEYGPK